MQNAHAPLAFCILHFAFVHQFQRGLAAGGDPKVGRPGWCGRRFCRLADGSKVRLTGQPGGRAIPPEEERCFTSRIHAAAIFSIRDLRLARSGVGCSTRMKAPSRVLNKNRESTRALSSAAHES